MKNGDVFSRENGNGIRVIKWQDKRSVTMISSNPELGETLVPSKANSNRGNAPMKPKSVVAYNTAKKGVDVSDQMSAYLRALDGL